MKTHLHLLLFIFFSISAVAQTEKKIQILNEKGEKPITGTEECFIYFNKNNNVIKRKIEQGEIPLLSANAVIVAILKAKDEYSPFDISIYNKEGDLIKRIYNDSIVASGGFTFADDGHFAYFQPTYIDEIGSAPLQLTFYSKEAKKIKSMEELFLSNMISTFSKNGKFALFAMTEPENIENGRLLIFDSTLTQTGTYIFKNFHYKSLYVTKDPIKFDENENVVLSTYDLIEYEDNSKNKLIKYRVLIDQNGNFIKREEGWENE